MTRILLLPGMDGTDALFRPFVVVRDYVGVELEEASAIVLGSYDGAALDAVNVAVQDALDAGNEAGAERLRVLQVQFEAMLEYGRTT